jgi:hypothetical protein
MLKSASGWKVLLFLLVNDACMGSDFLSVYSSRAIHGVLFPYEEGKGWRN